MSEAAIYLVRHGRYRMGDLSDEGRNIDAPKARDTLVEKNLGSNVLLLSSSYPRAIQTAEIIGGGIGNSPLISDWVAKGADFIKGINDLDAFLDKSLKEIGITKEPEQPLIVVAHAPMLAIAKGWYSSGSENDIGYGEVLEYVPGTWDNRRFDQSEELLLNSILGLNEE